MGQVLPFRRQAAYPEDEPWMRDYFLAERLGVSARTIQRWQSKGMPSRKLGRSRLYQEGPCVRWAQEYGESL